MAEASRYQSVAVLTLIATITLGLAALPKGQVSRPVAIARLTVIFALLLITVLVITNRTNLHRYVLRNQQKAIAEIALRLGVQADRHLKATTPAPGELDRLIPVLRAAHHVPFNRGSVCEDVLGEHIPETVVSPNGAIEKIATYEMSHGSGRAIELSGWAERNGEEAECVIVLDGARRVVGAGTSIMQRPDQEGTKSLLQSLIGWQAVARFPQTMPLCVVAFFPNPDQWLELAGCQPVG
jgi:hypothetical protein